MGGNKHDNDISNQQNISVGQIKHRLTVICFWSVAISQLVILILAGIVFNIFRGVNGNLAFAITMTAFIVIELIVILVVNSIVMHPLDIISRAISNVIGEKPSVHPPNPNGTTGPVKKEISKAVNYIYTVSQQANKTANTSETNANAKVATNLLRALPIGIITLDRNLNITAFNDKAPVYQTGKDKIIQLDFSTSGQPIEEWFMKVRDSAVSATRTWTRIQNVPSGSMQERHVYDVVANYRQQDDNKNNLIIVTIDRTADYADSEDNVDFVSLAAHELRGPITVIRGYLDMLDEEIRDHSTPQQKELLDRLNVSARRLTSYINNVLNANRFDKHHLKLKLAKVRLADVVADVQTDLNLRASTVNRSIVWDVSTSLPAVAADASTISEVITNLVDNAIKYSHKYGTIEVTAKRDGDFVSMSITDHGIGIAQSAIEKLFTKFYRSHRSSASIGGTGIGLYISRAIIESHGGTIGVNSVEGQGSTFTFTLPIYSAVKSKLATNNNSNEQLVTKNVTAIRNHGSISH